MSKFAQSLRLSTGQQMPRVGLGTAYLKDDIALSLIECALEMGYRSIDTASSYGTERVIGKALSASGLPRSELFVTTKLSNGDQGASRVYDALGRSLSELGLDYVDLYLIHWPVPRLGVFVETWEAVMGLAARGMTKAIGVCNFEAHHLDALAERGLTVPAVNQIELHPGLPQSGLRKLHASRGIGTVSWSPLAGGVLSESDLMAKIADRHSATAAQVALKWNMQLGNVVIPKASSAARLIENFQSAEILELTAAEVEQITAMGSDWRTGPHPDSFG